MPKYYLDLFAGIGGFALGAYWAGMEFDKHYFSEVDPYAISVYQKRFPDAVCLGDIKSIEGGAKLPRGDWFFSGGFPCQDISVAGKGAGLEGSRSGLWFEYARLISEFRPKYAIIENVGALAVRGLQQVLCSLAEIGYDAVWQDIRACDLGAPHRRERIWIVAYPESDRCFQRNAPQNGCKEREAGNYLKERQDRDKLSERMGEDVAYADTERQPWRSEYPANARNMPGAAEKRCPDVPYAGCEGVHEPRISGNAQRNSEQQRGIFEYGLPGRREKESGDLADTDSPGFQTPGAEQQTAGIIGCGEVSDAGNNRPVKRQRELRSDQQTVWGGEDYGRRTAVNAFREWRAAEP
jgi:site-specific DNA-cytosine methylase